MRAAAVLVLLLGLGVILFLPLALGWRVAAALLWSLLACRDLVQLEYARGRCAKIRVFPQGQVLLYGSDGRLRDASIVSGSIVLRRLAWLRMRLPNGCCYSALLRGNSRESQQWRRLQVIWRHLGSAG